MNKQQLVVQLSDLLDKSIELYEVTDLKLESGDGGPLCAISADLERTIESLRRARRLGRVLLQEYNDDLSKKGEDDD